MSALVCDICGGNLAMNESGEFAICESCGMKHTKERVKVKVQEIKGVVEVTKGEAEKERLLKNAETFLTVGEIDKAQEIYNQLINDYPDDYRVWYESLKYDCNYGVPAEPIRYANPLEAGKVVQLYIDICQTASIIHKLNGNMDEMVVSNIELFLDKIQEIHIWEYVKSLRENFDNLGDFTQCFLDRYESVMAYDKIRCDFENSPNLKHRIFTIVYQNSKTVYSTDKYNTFNPIQHKNRIINCFYYFGNYVGFYMPDNAWESAEIFHLEMNQKFNNVISCAVQENIENRKRNKLCQHCGGEFKGVFKKVCSKCGNPKDY